MNISIYMFFVVLCTFVGWDSLFEFITESILNSSKEVGSAAITTLHIVLTTHAVKVNLTNIFTLIFYDNGNYFSHYCMYPTAKIHMLSFPEN